MRRGRIGCDKCLGLVFIVSGCRLLFRAFRVLKTGPKLKNGLRHETGCGRTELAAETAESPAADCRTGLRQNPELACGQRICGRLPTAYGKLPIAYGKLHNGLRQLRRTPNGRKPPKTRNLRKHQINSRHHPGPREQSQTTQNTQNTPDKQKTQKLRKTH